MRFPAASRLRHQSDFVRLKTEGSRYDCGSFVLNAAPPSAGTFGRTRLGVIASKKMVGNRAVVRNRAKRIFRQIFRAHPDAFPAGWDVIVIARRSFSEQTSQELTVKYLEGARRLVAKISRRSANSQAEKKHEKKKLSEND